MLVELGHFALVLALAVAVAQGMVPLLGAWRRDRAMMAFAEPAALTQFAAVAFAFAVFMRAHVTSDFSVLNVVDNSLTTKPLFYKVTGVWGSHEGSMLLWVLILALYGALVAGFGRSLPLALRARAIAVQGWLGCGVLAFILGTSNPFQRIFPAPLEGHDQNPLLQDPGVAVHPPFLYFGYVGFSIAYSFALAGLMEGRVDAAWARWVRPWILLAWSGLTIGIALGSWWAYYVLGWGGWWYWDPVENASFMPWLLGTALLHSVAVLEKREALVRWTVLLSILTFSMSLIGTFLVRSGVLTSVHAFALDPARGIFILALIAVTIGAGLSLFALRGGALGSGNAVEPASREGALVLNNFLLSVGMAAVFLGTFYPLFAEIASGVKLSVGPQFFDLTFLPLMVPAILAMAVAPMLAWRKGDLTGTLRRLVPAGLVAILVPLAAGLVLQDGKVWPLAGLGLALWAAGGAVTDLVWRARLGRVGVSEGLRRLLHLPRSAQAGALAHLGVGVLIAGIAVSTGWKSEAIEILHPGETLMVAGRLVELQSVTSGQTDNYVWQRAHLSIHLPGGGRIAMAPERRSYTVAGSATTDTAISTNLMADLYAALGDPDGTGGWTVRIYYNPLVPWIWLGAGLAAAGGLLAFVDRRIRLPVALRRRVPGARERAA